MMTAAEIVSRAARVFHDEAAAPPPLTLRGASAVDSYERPEPFDAREDAPTDAYLERFAFWGVIYLDARSWRHYLPRLIEYALSRPDDPAMVTEALIRSLRPPDKYPPRLASLTGDQEAVVRSFLESVAFDHPASSVQFEAQQALEEWWLPGPRARPTAAEVLAQRAVPVVYRDASEDIYRLTIPDTLTASGLRQIPSESRRVQTWGGYLCGDVHTVVAINITPLALRSADQSIARLATFFEVPARTNPISVAGAHYAVRVDGDTHADSPGDPQAIILVAAESGSELLTLTIRTWERDDVRREVERIVQSLEVRPVGPLTP